jgi:hypothetical protein
MTITQNDASDRCGITIRHFRRLLATYRLDPVDVQGRALLYDPRAVDAMWERHNAAKLSKHNGNGAAVLTVAQAKRKAGRGTR